MILFQVAVSAAGMVVGAVVGLIASQQALWWALYLKAKRIPRHSSE